jgi:hypothetical protein
MVMKREEMMLDHMYQDHPPQPSSPPPSGVNIVKVLTPPQTPTIPLTKTATKALALWNKLSVAAFNRQKYHQSTLQSPPTPPFIFFRPWLDHDACDEGGRIDEKGGVGVRSEHQKHSESACSSLCSMSLPLQQQPQKEIAGRIQCTMCQVAYKQHKSLRMHTVKKHGFKLSIKSGNMGFTPLHEVDTIPCDLCDRTFTYPNNLKKHITAEHSRVMMAMSIISSISGGRDISNGNNMYHPYSVTCGDKDVGLMLNRYDKMWQ